MYGLDISYDYSEKMCDFVFKNEFGVLRVEELMQHMSLPKIDDYDSFQSEVLQLLKRHFRPFLKMYRMFRIFLN